MTTIDDITILPSVYTYGDFDVMLVGLVDDIETFTLLRHLFDKTRGGTAIQQVPGRRPIGVDHTEDDLNIRYVKFTHGEKAEDGYYLLQSINLVENETPWGADCTYGYEIGLFYLGNESLLQLGFRVKNLEKDSDNSWGI